MESMVRLQQPAKTRLIPSDEKPAPWYHEIVRPKIQTVSGVRLLRQLTVRKACGVDPL